jgi:hypothetical protein
MYFIAWWVGLLVLIFVTPAISRATKQTAMQFMIDRAAEDSEFYDYAVSEGVLYSAYIHPLSELSESQLTSAIEQVANLAITFGYEYTSGTLEYGGKK